MKGGEGKANGTDPGNEIKWGVAVSYERALVVWSGFPTVGQQVRVVSRSQTPS